MENLFPTSLDEYCTRFNIALSDLRLRCVFCNYYLSPQQLFSFYQKHLCLIWKNFNCFACCLPCIRLAARFEQENYTQCAVDCGSLETFLGVSINIVKIRCLFCLRLLTVLEKRDCISKKEQFYLVRGRWRGCCRECLFKE